MNILALRYLMRSNIFLINSIYGGFGSGKCKVFWNCKCFTLAANCVQSYSLACCCPAQRQFSSHLECKQKISFRCKCLDSYQAMKELYCQTLVQTLSRSTPNVSRVISNSISILESEVLDLELSLLLLHTLSLKTYRMILQFIQKYSRMFWSIL